VQQLHVQPRERENFSKSRGYQYWSLGGFKNGLLSTRSRRRRLAQMKVRLREVRSGEARFSKVIVRLREVRSG